MTQADKGAIQAPLPHGLTQSASFTPPILRRLSARCALGLQDSHAKGMAVQFNYFLDKGAFVANADGTFSVDLGKSKTPSQGLTANCSRWKPPAITPALRK